MSVNPEIRIFQSGIFNDFIEYAVCVWITGYAVYHMVGEGSVQPGSIKNF